MTQPTENRFSLRREEDASWTVFDIFTGEPAVWNDKLLIGLDMDDADDLVDLLNTLYINRRNEEGKE